MKITNIFNGLLTISLAVYSAMGCGPRETIVLAGKSYRSTRCYGQMGSPSHCNFTTIGFLNETEATYWFGGIDTPRTVKYTVSGSDLVLTFTYLENSPRESYQIVDNGQRIINSYDNEILNLSPQ